jgi:hypothetical protein
VTSPSSTSTLKQQQGRRYLVNSNTHNNNTTSVTNTDENQQQLPPPQQQQQLQYDPSLSSSSSSFSPVVVVNGEDSSPSPSSVLLQYHEIHEKYMKVVKERDELVLVCEEQQATLDRLLVEQQEWATIQQECDFWKATVEQQIFDSLPPNEIRHSGDGHHNTENYPRSDNGSHDRNNPNNVDDGNYLSNTTTGTAAISATPPPSSEVHTEKGDVQQQQQQITTLQGQIEGLKDLLLSQGIMYENRLNDQSIKTQIATTALEMTKGRMISLNDMVLTLQSIISVSQQPQQQANNNVDGVIGGEGGSGVGVLSS